MDDEKEGFEIILKDFEIYIDNKPNPLYLISLQ